MPLPLVPLIAAGAGLFENIFNSGTQKSINNQQLIANAQMMHQQRDWAVEDWNKQNAYNSPAAQMQRYKDAGLNPNLIYGQSNTAAPVRSSEGQPARLNAPQLNIGSIVGPLMEIFNIAKTQAQTNNLQKQYDLITAQQRLTTGNAIQQEFKNTYLNTPQMADYQLEYKQQLNRNLFKDELLKEKQIDKTAADTSYTKDQNIRSALLTSANLKQMAQRVLLMKAQTENTEIGKRILYQQINNLQQDSYVKQQLGSVYAQKLFNDAKAGDDKALEEVTKMIIGVIK